MYHSSFISEKKDKVGGWLTYFYYLPGVAGVLSTHSNFKSLTGLQQESTNSHCGIARHSTAIVRLLPQGKMEINERSHQLNMFTECPHKLKEVQSVFCVTKITPNKMQKSRICNQIWSGDFTVICLYRENTDNSVSQGKQLG